MTTTADVVLPRPEEAGAPAWVLERLPPGWGGHRRGPRIIGAGGPEQGRCPMTTLMVIAEETAGVR